MASRTQYDFVRPVRFVRRSNRVSVSAGNRTVNMIALSPSTYNNSLSNGQGCR